MWRHAIVVYHKSLNKRRVSIRRRVSDKRRVTSGYYLSDYDVKLYVIFDPGTFRVKLAAAGKLAYTARFNKRRVLICCTNKRWGVYSGMYGMLWHCVCSSIGLSLTMSMVASNTPSGLCWMGWSHLSVGAASYSEDNHGDIATSGQTKWRADMEMKSLVQWCHCQDELHAWRQKSIRWESGARHPLQNIVITVFYIHKKQK